MANITEVRGLAGCLAGALASAHQAFATESGSVHFSSLDRYTETEFGETMGRTDNSDVFGQ